MGRRRSKFNRHLFLPDFQVKPGVRTDHIGWIAHYLADRNFTASDTVAFAGDWADIPSLSSYDKGKKSFEGRRYKADIAAYVRSVDLFFETFRKRQPDLDTWPAFKFTNGNHEHRITRAVEEQPELEGLISVEQDIYGPLREWEVDCYDYQVPVYVDGVAYSHNFVNPKSLTKSILAGTIDNRLSKLMHSFTMGHQQVLQYGMAYPLGNRAIHGLVAGSCYLHDEEYMGPQGNDHWRGIILKNEVRDGSYNPCFISLDYLGRRYG